MVVTAAEQAKGTPPGHPIEQEGAASECAGRHGHEGRRQPGCGGTPPGVGAQTLKATTRPTHLDAAFPGSAQVQWPALVQGRPDAGSLRSRPLRSPSLDPGDWGRKQLPR